MPHERDPSALRAIVRSTRRPILERAFLAAIVVCVFLLAAPGGHYFFDTHFIVSQSAELVDGIRSGEPGAIYSLFRYPEDVRAGRVWPLMRPYFTGLYAVFGDNFLAWQWWNAFLYALTAQLIYSLAARLSDRRIAPLIAGLLYLSYFPGVLIVHGLMSLENAISPLVCAAFLCLWHMRRAAEDSRRASVWAGALGAAALTAIAIGLKETSLAFAPAVIFIATAEAWRGPRALWRPAWCIVGCTTFVCGALVWVVLTDSLQSGWYAQSYDPSDPLHALASMEWWRRSLLTIYGPLAVLWMAALAGRLIVAAADRRWNPDLTWRIALASVPIGMIVLVSPKAPQQHPYFNTAAAFMAIGMAWEAADFARLLIAGRTPRDRAATGRAQTGLLGALALAAAAAWCLPIVADLRDTRSLALKLAAVALCAVLMAAAVRHARGQWVRHGGLDAPFRRSGVAFLALCVIHIAVFAVPNVFLLPQLERQRFKSLDMPLSYLADRVPAHGRVVDARYGSVHSFRQLGLHMSVCKGRPDITVEAFPPSVEDLQPEDFLLDVELSVERPLELPGRERIDFSTTALVYKPDRVQPAVLAASLLGRSAPAPGHGPSADRRGRWNLRESLFYPYFARGCALCWYPMTRSVYLPESPG